MKSLLFSILSILTASAFLAGCGGGDSASSDGDPNKTFRIAVVPKGTNHMFWKTIHAGAIKAAQKQLPPLKVAFWGL